MERSNWCQKIPESYYKHGDIKKDAKTIYKQTGYINTYGNSFYVNNPYDQHNRLEICGANVNYNQEPFKASKPVPPDRAYYDHWYGQYDKFNTMKSSVAINDHLATKHNVSNYNYPSIGYCNFTASLGNNYYLGSDVQCGTNYTEPNFNNHSYYMTKNHYPFSQHNTLSQAYSIPYPLSAFEPAHSSKKVYCNTSSSVNYDSYDSSNYPNTNFEKSIENKQTNHVFIQNNSFYIPQNIEYCSTAATSIAGTNQYRQGYYDYQYANYQIDETLAKNNGMSSYPQLKNCDLQYTLPQSIGYSTNDTNNCSVNPYQNNIDLNTFRPMSNKAQDIYHFYENTNLNPITNSDNYGDTTSKTIREFLTTWNDLDDDDTYTRSSNQFLNLSEIVFNPQINNCDQHTLTFKNNKKKEHSKVTDKRTLNKETLLLYQSLINKIYKLKLSGVKKTISTAKSKLSALYLLQKGFTSFPVKMNINKMFLNIYRICTVVRNPTKKVKQNFNLLRTLRYFYSRLQKVENKKITLYSLCLKVLEKSFKVKLIPSLGFLCQSSLKAQVTVLMIEESQFIKNNSESKSNMANMHRITVDAKLDELQETYNVCSTVSYNVDVYEENCRWHKKEQLIKKLLFRRKFCLKYREKLLKKYIFTKRHNKMKKLGE